jgi:hypothetical protein
MDKKTAEVVYWMAEFASESGQWFNLCAFLEEKGIAAKQVADAVNSAAKCAGFNSDLKPEDCE